MPALFPLRLALTKEQDAWIRRRSAASGKSGAEIISSLLEAEIGGENPTARLAEVVRLLTESEARSRRLEASLAKQHEVVMVFLKEMYREGSANLYRIESVLNDMPNGVVMKQRLNEYVRTRDREMGEKLHALHLTETNR